MSRSLERLCSARTQVAIAAAFVCLCGSSSNAQQQEKELLQIEVTDAKGIPLPDAKIETFAFLDGGVFREWAEVVPEQLPTGIYLMRFSNPGYRSSTFSVPLQHGVTLSVLVRLHEGSDSLRYRSKQKELQYAAPEAIVVAFNADGKADLLGHRRVFDQIPTEEGSGAWFNFRDPKLKVRRQPSTIGKIDPVMGESWKNHKGTVNCPLKALINGDTRLPVLYGNFGHNRSIEDIEALEIFTEGAAIPQAYRVPGSGCGLAVVWFRS